MNKYSKGEKSFTQPGVMGVKYCFDIEIQEMATEWLELSEDPPVLS